MILRNRQFTEADEIFLIKIKNKSGNQRTII